MAHELGGGVFDHQDGVRKNRGTSAYTRFCTAMFVVGFVTFSDLYGVQPLFSELVHDFGASVAQSSLALSLSTAFLAVSILASGLLTGHRPRRPIILWSLAGASLLNVVAAFVPNWHGFLLARASEGLALGAVPALAMAYIGEEITPHDLGHAMGIYIGGTACGGMVGRILVSTLAGEFGWRAGLATLSLLDLAAVGSLLFLLPATRPSTSAQLTLNHHGAIWKRHLTTPALVCLFAIGGLGMGAFVTIFNYLDFRLQGAPFYLHPMARSLFFLCYGVSIVTSPRAGALADRLGQGPVILGGIVLTALGIIATGQALLPVMIGGMILFIGGFFAIHTVASGWVGRIAGTEKAQASALYLLCYYLGSSLFGSFGGVFWSRGGWTLVTAYTLVLLGFAAAMAFRLMRHPPRYARSTTATGQAS